MKGTNQADGNETDECSGQFGKQSIETTRGASQQITGFFLLFALSSCLFLYWWSSCDRFEPIRVIQVLTFILYSCLQAKDSDDDEEVVQVDRDHFMDEFFEQVRHGDARPVVSEWSSLEAPASHANSWSIRFSVNLTHLSGKETEFIHNNPEKKGLILVLKKLC